MLFRSKKIGSSGIFGFIEGEQKKRGRPAADALKNPIKNPETGMFEDGPEEL